MENITYEDLIIQFEKLEKLKEPDNNKGWVVFMPLENKPQIIRLVNKMTRLRVRSFFCKTKPKNNRVRMRQQWKII